MVTSDEAIHERVRRDVARAAADLDPDASPVVMGQYIHRRIRELTGENDPYHAIKTRFNRLALELLPVLEKRVMESPHPLETAVRLAIAGNIIDFGVTADIDDVHVHQSIGHALKAPLNGDIERFAEAVRQAKDILYLADNAGEIVFDRLLIEQLPKEKITVAVRGSPVINDATIDDAEITGLTQLVPVIDNGDDAPGTILESCSRSFRQRFGKADMVLAKGQGNYESLSDVSKNMFFILKAKCPVIADDIGFEVGSLILRDQRHS